MKTQILLPQTIKKALALGADLAISFSGGKDSQAMLNLLLNHPDRTSWTGRVYAIHADLGLAEWHNTHAFCESYCKSVGIELVTVTRVDKKGLIERIEDRAETLKGTDKPHFPSSAARYCTSDLKRNPIDAYLRTGSDLVISFEGVRADESTARAKKPVFEMRKQITSTTYKGSKTTGAPELPLNKALDNLVEGKRLAIDYRPIFDFNTSEVFAACGTSLEAVEIARNQYKDIMGIRNAGVYSSVDAQGAIDKIFESVPVHPAYAIGNTRLSCAMCVLASKSDIINGAIHNIEAFRRLVKSELKTGYTFTNDLSLASMSKTIEEQHAAIYQNGYELPTC